MINAHNCYRFEEHEAPGSRSFFTDIIASISDIKFAKDGRHILSRDYMTLKVSVFGIRYLSIYIYIHHNLAYNNLHLDVEVEAIEYVAFFLCMCKRRKWIAACCI